MFNYSATSRTTYRQKFENFPDHINTSEMESACIKETKECNKNSFFSFVKMDNVRLFDTYNYRLDVGFAYLTAWRKKKKELVA